MEIPVQNGSTAMQTILDEIEKTRVECKRQLSELRVECKQIMWQRLSDYVYKNMSSSLTTMSKIENLRARGGAYLHFISNCHFMRNFLFEQRIFLMRTAEDLGMDESEMKRIFDPIMDSIDVSDILFDDNENIKRVERELREGGLPFLAFLDLITGCARISNSAIMFELYPADIKTPRLRNEWLKFC